MPEADFQLLDHMLELLEAEKELTRRSDELAQRRQELQRLQRLLQAGSPRSNSARGAAVDDRFLRSTLP
jgi:chromosome condensin MukBEF ATPase and DNA-binding subunit MukB